MGTAVALKHKYAPRGACLLLFGERGAEVLLSGPAGTGKSRACLEKLHTMALLNGGMRGLIVRKTASSLTSTALVTWKEHVVAESLANKDCYYYGGSNAESAQYRYTNGSTVVVGGIDKSSKIMSSEYDLIYVQEATELTEADWEALTTRLRNNKVSFQQIIADCNPAQPTHWLKKRADRGQTIMLNSRHEDNPTLFTSIPVKRADTGEEETIFQVTDIGKSYIDKLDNLTGVRHKRLRLGLWAAAEGLIYEDWNPEIHVLDRYIGGEGPKQTATKRGRPVIKPEWPAWWAVDFGFTNPFVWQLWREDPDGRLYLQKEIYRTQRTVKEHAAEILKIVKRKGEWLYPKPLGIICDHDAEGRTVLEQEIGVRTTNAHKAVGEGIQAVQDRLKEAPDGRPRLFVLRGALVHPADPNLVDAKKPTCTEEELLGYVWDTSNGKRIKESPLKEDDHGCDAMRYLVAQRDLRKHSRVRFMG